jgi:hypothetical protein
VRPGNNLPSGFNKVIPRWAMWAITATPLVVMIAGLVLMVDAYRFVSEAERVTAMVIDAGRYHDSEGRTFYRPTLRYRRDDGEEFEAKLDFSVGVQVYRAGDEVEILYSRDEPEVARLDNFFLLYGVAPFLAGFGAVFVAVMLWFRFDVAREYARAQQRAPPETVTPETAPATSHAGSGGGSDQIRKGRRASVSGIRRYVPDWIWWLLVAFLSLWVLAGIGLAVDALVFFSDAKKTQGEVVRVNRYVPNTYGASYHAMIRYRRDDGVVFEAKTHIPMSTYNFPIGAKVDIYYSPSRPKRVRIANFVSIYFPSIFFLLFGGLSIFLVLWARGKARYSVAPSWQEEGAAVFNVQAEEAKLRDNGVKLAGSVERDHVERRKPLDPATVRRGR